MYTREELKSKLFDFARYMLVLDLLKEKDMSVGELKEKAKESIGSNANKREVPKALSNCEFISCDDINDDLSMASFNSNKARTLFSEVQNYFNLICPINNADSDIEVKADEDIRDEEIGKSADIEGVWQEIKTVLFETPVTREGGICIHDNLGNEIGREQIRIYPYFPEELEPIGRKNRKPIFPTATNPTPILNDENIKKNNISSGSRIFKRVVEEKKQIESDSKIPKERKEEMFSAMRKELVRETLENQNLTNEAKMAQYSVITQMPPEIYHLLFSAVANGVDAESIITFLEEPVSAFNYEAVRNYISIAGNKNAISVRLQLARDLVDGKWAISGTDGKLYTVINSDLLLKIKELINRAAQEKRVSGNFKDCNPEGED